MSSSWDSRECGRFIVDFAVGVELPAGSPVDVADVAAFSRVGSVLSSIPPKGWQTEARSAWAVSDSSQTMQISFSCKATGETGRAHHHEEGEVLTPC